MICGFIQKLNLKVFLRRIPTENHSGDPLASVIWGFLQKLHSWIRIHPGIPSGGFPGKKLLKDGKFKLFKWKK